MDARTKRSFRRYPFIHAAGLMRMPRGITQRQVVLTFFILCLATSVTCNFVRLFVESAAVEWTGRLALLPPLAIAATAAFYLLFRRGQSPKQNVQDQNEANGVT